MRDEALQWAAAADWHAELERRAHLATVPEWIRRASEWGDLASLVRGFGGDAVPEPAVKRPAPGLVSHPTSDTRSARPPVVPFAVQVDTAAMLRASSSFCPDAAAGKLARLRRCVGATARLFGAVPDAGEVVMVTLTYRGTNEDWSPRDITEFCKRFRAWAGRRGFQARYVWVAELQKRGTIHYHVALWLPDGHKLPKPDQCGWWTHGMTRIERARHAVRYLMKYLSKGVGGHEKARLPVGARSHGRGGLTDGQRGVLRWLSYPAFIRARADVSQRWRRVVGGGWADPSGELFRSEFARVKTSAGWALTRVFDHGRPFAADGPFSWWGAK